VELKKTKLRLVTIERLQKAYSWHKKDGFHTTDQVRDFWSRFGAMGFLNIKEITPGMVQEIRREIIEKNQTGV